MIRKITRSNSLKRYNDNGFKNFILNQDIFGPEVRITQMGKKNMNTIFGGIYSFIFKFLIFCYFGLRF